MDHSSWVTTKKGFPAARHVWAMRFWAEGSSHRGILFPRSPRAMQITSASSRISSSFSIPRRFSILAIIFTWSNPSSARAERRVRRSSRPRTKGWRTWVTPNRPAWARLARSSAVRVGESTSRPSRARLLRLLSSPPRSTRQVRRSGPASSTVSRRALSSRESWSPGRAASTTLRGTGMPPEPSRAEPPSRRETGSSSRPTRSSGPWRSTIRLASTPACRAAGQNSSSSREAHSGRVVWDRFSRAPVIPA